MRALLFALALVLAPLCARAQSAEAVAKFTPQEQILLPGLLADPAENARFAQEAKAGVDDAFMLRWRGRLADFSKGYLAKKHDINEKAPTLRQALEPSEWAILMATLKALGKSTSWGDQAKFKIFMGMVESADEGLKAGDPSGARKVAETAEPKLVEALKEFLASDNAKAGLAEQTRLAALEKAQAETAREQAEKAAQTPKTAERVFDATPKKKKVVTTPVDEPTPVIVPPVEEQKKEPPVVLSKPAKTETPSLVVKNEPPAPASSSIGADDDFAQLKKMKQDNQDKTGSRKWYAAGLGALLGGLIGFLVGGPIGALAGAALLGGAGFVGARHFFG